MQETAKQVLEMSATLQPGSIDHHGTQLALARAFPLGKRIH
jgi:hypothetical protein